MPFQTTISGTLVDSGGTTWGNAPITIIFFPTPSPGPYVWQGGSYQQLVTTRTDNVGHFSIILPDNSTIAPSGSKWQFIISPSATLPAVVFALQALGPAMDIGGIFTTQSYQLQSTLVQSTPIPRAYKDAEVAIPPFDGQLYFDTTLKQYKVWYNNMWNPLVSGGGGGGSCTGTATHILWLPTDNTCAADGLFWDAGNPPLGSGVGGLNYTGQGSHFSSDNAGSFMWDSYDPVGNTVGVCNTKFSLSGGGNQAANFEVNLDTTGGTVDTSQSGNIKLYTKGHSSAGNNIFLTAIASPQQGGAGNITLQSFGQLSLICSGSNIHMTSPSGIIVDSGDQTTSFAGGIAPKTIVISAGPYTAGTGGETTILASADSGILNISLPVTVNDGRIFTFKKIDTTTNNVVIGAGAAIIDSASTYLLTVPNQAVTLQYGSGTWAVISTKIDAAPTPPPTIPAFTAQDHSSDRTLGGIYRNLTGAIIFVSGFGITHGGHTGSVEVFIGATSPPTMSIFCATQGATVEGGGCGFSFSVPNNWYYQVQPNTHVNSGDSAVYALSRWVEVVLA